jgi:mannose-6-phosphate isomerase
LPVLVKFLFTSARLSVQVHPGDDYARRHENSAGKTEMWHILRAQPGAEIASGFREPVTRERLREISLSGEIENMLRWIPVAAGETYFTPAGTVHAIGAGVALCEIQQVSDVTYRLYDYGRPRELHLDKAVDVADLESQPGAQPANGDVLVECPYFRTEKLRFAGASRYGCDRAHFLIVVEGAGWFADRPCRAGEVWLAPAGTEFRVYSAGQVRILRASIPARIAR